MKITDQDVLYVAELANLELTAEERSQLTKDLSAILEYIDRLNELDTTDVPPMAQVSGQYGSPEQGDGRQFEYAQRPDIPGECLPREAALMNAPETDGIFFKVPKVIDKK